MNKVIRTLLASILCMSMVACSGNTEGNKKNDSSLQTSDDANQNNENIELEKEGKKEEVKFEEIVVVDNEECIIKITGIEPDSMWGYGLKVNLENKSSDKTYMFSVESGAINGVQADPLFATEVASGKKANDDLSFMTSDELEDRGIKEFTDIELTFRVYDSNDLMADEVANETIHIYPYGEENAVQFIREAKSTDTVLVDNDFVTAIVTGYEEDSIWGYTANLFLVNKSDKNIMFSVDEVSINGYMADPFFADLVLAGKCAFSSISWSDSIFEENGITEIEEIELLLKAYYEDDFMSDGIVNETITLIP